MHLLTTAFAIIGGLFWLGVSLVLIAWCWSIVRTKLGQRAAQSAKLKQLAQARG